MSTNIRPLVLCDSEEATQLGKWFHGFRFPDGVEVGKSVPHLKFTELIVSLDLKGKTVIEVGCNAGAMTRLLEEHGATVWPFDVVCKQTGRWKNQFNLIKKHVGIKADFHEGDVYDLKEKADIVFMVGIYYHLEHPRLGIQAAWTAATECLIIEGEVMVDEDRPVALFPSKEEPYNKDVTNCFIPSKSVLKGMLARLEGVKNIIELDHQPSRVAFRVER